MQIKELTDAQELASARDLIARTFELSEAVDYGSEGRRSFYSLLDKAVCLAGVFPGSFIFYGLIYSNLAAVCVCTEAHISMLFVDSAYQRQGCGRALIQYVRSRLSAQGFKKFTVYAAPQAADFYRKLGFRDMSGVLCRDGIKYIAMEAMTEIPPSAEP